MTTLPRRELIQREGRLRAQAHLSLMELKRTNPKLYWKQHIMYSVVFLAILIGGPATFAWSVVHLAGIK